MKQPKVYVVLVNFNGHQNTIETLESLAKQSYREFQVVIIDNNTPTSLQIIKNWADGIVQIEFNPPDSIRQYCLPYCLKPLVWMECEVDGVIDDGNKQAERKSEREIISQQSSVFKFPLVLVQAKRDVGFAGGNNIGIRYALQNGDADYVWLLNNDTTLQFDALKELVSSDEDYKSRGEKVGIIGSKLLWYRWPEKINAIGGRFSKWTTWSYHLGLNEVDYGQYDQDNVHIDYIYGASLFMRREFLEEVGLMNEVYYAYFEEMDWEIRGRRKGWKHGYAFKSIIYHKQGVTTGKEIKSKRRPLFFMCCKFRGWLLFYQAYYPYLIFAPVIRLLLKSLKNLSEGNYAESLLIIKILLGKRTCNREMK